MNAQQNIALVRRLYEEIYSKSNTSEKLPEYYAETVKFYDPALKSGQNLQGYKAAQKKYQTAFPDRKTTIDEISAAEDRVVVRWTTTATHKGKLDDLEPSNKKIKISGISVYRFSNGKIAEVYQVWDRLGLLEQIGEVQPALALHA